MNKLKTGKLRSIANDFKNDSIITDGSILRCNLYNVVIAVDDKHQKTRLRQHIESSKHIKSSFLKNPISNHNCHSTSLSKKALCKTF